VTSYRLRTDSSQPPPSAPTISLDWYSGRAGSTIQVRENLTQRLTIPPAALDLLHTSAAVYCADRLTPRPSTWTRTIDLEVPVDDIDAWQAVKKDLDTALLFLSGDRWQISPFGAKQEFSIAGPNSAEKSVDVVCLFSGGLDSFTGAADLLAHGKRVCLVAHYETGQAPKAQERLARMLSDRFGRDNIVLRRAFLRPASATVSQGAQLPEDRETSTRSRSLLFLAAGLAVAAGYGPTVSLYIPENGFIGINVPLTAARSGSLSTRTTHPYFIASLRDLALRLGIPNPVVNPFRLKTKGEMLADASDQAILREYASATVSCAHPEAPRYAKRKQGNCGYCFPCLIRRAAMHRIGLDESSEYSFDALTEDLPLAGERGSDLRALLRSVARPAQALDVLRNGPIPDGEFSAFADVYKRGRLEILTWLRESPASTHVRQQVPRK
jgi:7-cyano-7-deazaguanine synthase in queuosine biosynthesis